MASLWSDGWAVYEEFFSDKGNRMSDVSGGPQTKLRESISALIDGEADELELRRVLASADTREVRDVWRDYHIQRDTLAGADMRFAHIDLSQRIQVALAEESVMPAAAGARWWRPLASVAVAASVAAVVVVGARSLNSSNGGADIAAAQPVINITGATPAAAGTFSPLNNVSASTTTPYPAFAQPAALDPDQFARERLQQYLLRHTERAALNNGQGVMSFSKVSELGDGQ